MENGKENSCGCQFSREEVRKAWEEFEEERKLHEKPFSFTTKVVITIMVAFLMFWPMKIFLSWKQATILDGIITMILVIVVISYDYFNRQKGGKK